MVRRFIILGASGDLTTRYLLPALSGLHQAGKLPADLSVLGVAQEDWNTDAFRRHVAERLERHAGAVESSARRDLIARLEYQRADVTDEKEIAKALGALTEPVVVYLALPPSLFGPAAQALAALRLLRGSRIVVEKPFGEDLASAHDLNRILHDAFPEEAVFRIDHFLGKQTVQNILGLRFANRIFEPLWNSQHIDRVEVTWDETLALEGRASYYDRAGALRDMIQNHLLQLLALVAMEPPATLHERDFRDRKVDVFRAVRRLAPDEIVRRTVRGRYRAGRIGERAVVDYIREPGVDPDRGVETFAQVCLSIDNWRWAGVPFMVRTGKALGAERREIAILFKCVPHLAFGQAVEPPANVLRLQLTPDRVALDVNINGPGDPFELEQVALETTLAPHEFTAYGRLLVDVMEGNPILSTRDDEVEESWRIVEPILHTWRDGRVPLQEYAAGSAGPASDG